MSSFLELPVYDIKSGQDTNFEAIKGDKAMVVDFWHTKCVRCPAALEKLNSEAESFPSVLFVGCAISQGEGNLDVVSEVVSDWENMTHVFMSFEAKEAAKAILGFAAVPFAVVIGKAGTILGSGDPKSLNIHALIEQENSASTATGRAALVLDEDF